MNPRLRRLTLDAERLESRFQSWAPVRITARTGSPPERYQVTYHLKGLYTAADGRIVERPQHIMEVSLPLAYPRRAPQCKMLTPVFHPNFDATTVCIGDFWAASEGLDDLIIRIGRMIAFQEYNTKSPLNGLAARWTEQYAHLLPVDATEIAPPSSSAPAAEEKVVVSVAAPSSSSSSSSSSSNPITLTLTPTPEGHHLHATSPILLNGQPTTEATLKPGDRLQLGPLEAHFPWQV